MVLKLFLKTQQLVHVKVLFSIIYFLNVHKLDVIEISAVLNGLLDQKLVSGTALVKEKIG
jgi:hypothetical protein